MAPLATATTAALIPGAQARIDRSMDVAIAREAERLTGGLTFLATVGLDRALRRALRHGLGHQARLRGDRHRAEHQPRRGRARHRRGAAGHRPGPSGGDPGGDLLQQARPPTATGIVASYESLRRRVRHHPVAPAGRAEPWPRRRHSRAAAGSAARRRRAGAPADVRDQRHALRRRDAGAADHLHGRRAAADRRRAGRTAATPPPRPCRTRAGGAADRDADRRGRCADPGRPRSTPRRADPAPAGHRRRARRTTGSSCAPTARSPTSA